MIQNPHDIDNYIPSCRSCRWLQREFGFPFRLLDCTHPAAGQMTNGPILLNAWKIRALESACGVTGKWHEPRLIKRILTGVFRFFIS